MFASERTTRIALTRIHTSVGIAATKGVRSEGGVDARRVPTCVSVQDWNVGRVHLSRIDEGCFDGVGVVDSSIASPSGHRTQLTFTIAVTSWRQTNWTHKGGVVERCRQLDECNVVQLRRVIFVHWEKVDFREVVQLLELLCQRVVPVADNRVKIRWLFKLSKRKICWKGLEKESFGICFGGDTVICLLKAMRGA